MLGFLPQHGAIRKAGKSSGAVVRRVPSSGGSEEEEGGESEDGDDKDRYFFRESRPRKIPIDLPFKADYRKSGFQTQFQPQFWAAKREGKDSGPRCVPSTCGKGEENGCESVDGEGKHRILLQSKGQRKAPIEDTHKSGISDNLIFVGNIPFKASVVWLKATFQKFGPLLDAFIPNRISRGFKRKYGFVRFISDCDAERAISNLDGILVGNWNLIVQRSKPKSMRVLTKSQEKRYTSSSALSSSRGSGNSFSCQDKVSSNSKKRVLGAVKSLDWVNCAALAYLRKGECFIDIRLMILESCPGVKSISLIRNNFVLIVFQSSFQRGLAIEHGLWSQWFYSLNVWEEEKVGKENKIWVECVGIPFWAWNDSTFESIASVWGSILEVDSETADLIKVSSARLRISTSVSVIDEIIELEVDGRVFDIRVSSCQDQGNLSINQNSSCEYGMDPNQLKSKCELECQHEVQKQYVSKQKCEGQMVKSKNWVKHCCATQSSSSSGNPNLSDSSCKSINYYLYSAAECLKMAAAGHESELNCMNDTGKACVKNFCCRSHEKSEGGDSSCIQNRFQRLQEVSSSAESGEPLKEAGGLLSQQNEVIGMSGNDCAMSLIDSAYGPRTQVESERHQIGEGLFISGMEDANQVLSSNEGDPGVLPDFSARNEQELSCAAKNGTILSQEGTNDQVFRVEDPVGHRDSCRSGNSEPTEGEFGSQSEFNIDVFDTVILKAIDVDIGKAAEQTVKGGKVVVEVGGMR